MYFKLALRNAKRSLFDYLLFITTTVLLLLFMFISNYIGLITEVEAGFQSMSLPLLISIILIILVSYIHKFMLKQRAKEFANYILLGMEKKKLVNMFLCEFCIIGFLCFIVCSLLSFVICYIISEVLLSAGSGGLNLSIYFQCFGYTFAYFCIIELFSMYRIKRRICALEISELMVEKKRNQHLGGKRQWLVWGIIFLINMLILLLIFSGVVCLSNDMIMAIMSFAFLPIMLAVFSFYQWIYHYLSFVRQKQPLRLFHKERLYMIAKMTCGANTNSTLNGIYCMCLFLSSMSFVFGIFMFQSKFYLFDESNQLWMGFLQIMISLIFIVIYFSILSLQQVIAVQLQVREFRILHYLGKSKEQLKRIIIKQILVNLFFPTGMCFVILGISVPFINYKLNHILPWELNNFCIKTIGIFFLCFAVLYLLYFLIVYILSKNIAEIPTDEN